MCGKGVISQQNVEPYISQSTASLGVSFNGPPTMITHISSVSRTSFFQPRQLRSVCRSLTLSATHAVVSTWTIATHLLLASRVSISVGSECGSSTAVHCHICPRDTWLVTSSSTSDLQDDRDSTSTEITRLIFQPEMIGMKAGWTWMMRLSVLQMAHG